MAETTMQNDKKRRISTKDEREHEHEDDDKETYLRIEKNNKDETFKIYVQTKPQSEKVTILNPEGSRFIAYISDPQPKANAKAATTEVKLDPSASMPKEAPAKKAKKATEAEASMPKEAPAKKVEAATEVEASMQKEAPPPRVMTRRVRLGRVIEVIDAKNHNEMVKVVRKCPDVKYYEILKKMNPGPKVYELMKTKDIYDQRNRGPREILPALKIMPQIFVLEGKERVILVHGAMESLGNVMKELTLVNRTSGTVKCPCLGFNQIVLVNVAMIARLDDKAEMERLFEMHDEMCEEVMEALDAEPPKSVIFGEPDEEEGGREVSFDKHDPRFDIRVYDNGRSDTNDVMMRRNNTERTAIGFKAFYGRNVEKALEEWPKLDLTKIRVIYSPEGEDVIFTIKVRILGDGMDIVSECQRFMWRDVPAHFNTPTEYSSAVMKATAIRDLLTM